MPQIDSFHPIFEQAVSQMLLCGGKRFRPMLVLGVVDCFKPMLVKNSLDVALAVEMLHTYSLIHDDLPAMDDADLRRGQETIHITYDETTAILVGDGLNTHSFNLLSNSKLSNDIKIKLISQLSCDGGFGGMVTGQAIDTYFQEKRLTLKELKNLHINKTAKLIATSLKMGAIISQLDELDQTKLYNLGLDIGLLFQIQDDIIDATVTTKTALKTTNKDKDKNSFVTLLGLDKAKDYAFKALANLNYNKNQKVVTRANYLLGNIYRKKGIADSAIFYYSVYA